MMKTIRYRGEQGARSGILLKTGKKFFHVLLMDNPLRVKRVSLCDAEYLTDIDTPLPKARRAFRQAATCFHGGLKGCSKAVRLALR